MRLHNHAHLVHSSQGYKKGIIRIRHTARQSFQKANVAGTLLSLSLKRPSEIQTTGIGVRTPLIALSSRLPGGSYDISPTEVHSAYGTVVDPVSRLLPISRLDASRHLQVYRDWGYIRTDLWLLYVTRSRTSSADVRMARQSYREFEAPATVENMQSTVEH